MNISKKVLAALIVIAIIVTAVAMAAIFVPAVGAWFSTNFGGVGTGFLNLFTVPLTWALSGGGPTIAVFWGIIIIAALGFTYIVWHYDVPYKVTGVTAVTPATGYTNTMSREPPEPERSPTV